MRKVCVFSGSRADFGLLKPTLNELKRRRGFDLQLLVAGAHCSLTHGVSFDEILKEGFAPDRKVEMLLDADSPTAISKGMALGMIGISQALADLTPDLLVVLGDRYEAFVAAQSAMLLGIPIAHIHGGESTEGLIDEAIRHAITKMSHIHFVAANAFADVVIQLGEKPENVKVVGATCLDRISEKPKFHKADFEDFFELKFQDQIFVVTYHPVTLNMENDLGIDNLIAALDMLNNVSVIWTGVNADTKGSKLRKKINDFCAKDRIHRRSVESLGAQRYLDLLRISTAVIGNSSSGLLEAPAIGLPTLNIGQRQQGRLRAPSVIDVSDELKEIKKGLKQICSPEIISLANKRNTPYGREGAAEKIVSFLDQTDFRSLLYKRFHKL